MKKIVLMVIFSLVSFLIFDINGMAEVKPEMKCYYTGTTADLGSHSAIIEINDDNSISYTKITNKDEDYSATPSNPELLENWNSNEFYHFYSDKTVDVYYSGKKEYEKNKKCPPFFIYVYSGTTYYTFVSDKTSLVEATKNLQSLFTANDSEVWAMKLTKSESLKIKIDPNVCVYKDKSVGVSIKIDETANQTVSYSLEGSPNSMNNTTGVVNWTISEQRFYAYNRPTQGSYNEYKDYNYGYIGRENYISSKSCPEYVLYARYKVKKGATINGDGYNIYVTNGNNINTITKAVKSIILTEKENKEGEYYLVNIKLNEKVSKEATTTLRKETSEKKDKEEEVKADCSIFDSDTIDMLQKILNIFRILAPILALVFSAMDFLKAVAAGAKDDLKNAGTRMMKRLIIVALLFFVPTLISLLLTLIGNSNGTCGIS